MCFGYHRTCVQIAKFSGSHCINFNFSFGDELVKQIRTKIRAQLSARHVPQIILPIADIPYTASGKKVEVAVKRILNGEDIQQRGAFINPKSLDLYYNIPELNVD